MSIAEFSEAMRNKAVNSWFANEAVTAVNTSKPNVLVHGTDPYRVSEGVSEKNSFVITKDTIRGMLSSLGKDTRQTNKIFSKFLDIKEGAGSRIAKELITIPIKAANGRIVDVEAVYFPSISFDSITAVVNNVLDAPVGSVAQSYEKGHVLGLATNLLSTSVNRLDAEVSAPEGEAAKQLVLGQLNNVIAYYKKLDFASANLQPAASLEIYARSSKTMQTSGQTSYTIEFQPKAINQSSGKEVLATLGDIRKLFDPKVRQDRELKELINRLRKSVKDPEFKKQLLNLRSSPSMIEMINKQIRDTIAGTSKKQVYNTPLLKVASSKGVKADTRKISVEAKNKVAQLERLKQKITSAKPSDRLRSVKGQFYSLASLQILLNTHLQDVVSANMGDEGYVGGQRNILNYRTGRFASSVKVEKLMLSKEGMITAFYNYMKYPYSTFSEGGVQSRPSSRDPKVLIGKSIKEIAAIKVGNRLRAVLV